MARKPTIYEGLLDKLGREPTNAEIKAEVDRIKREALVELAGEGKLPFQRSRGGRKPPAKKTSAQLQREIDEVLARPQTASSSAFEEAKAEEALLEKEMSEAQAAINVFPRGPTGLTPDAVKSLPEWRAAKARVDKAFARLRAFNAVFVKRFAKELRAERSARTRERESRSRSHATMKTSSAAWKVESQDPGNTQWWTLPGSFNSLAAARAFARDWHARVKTMNVRVVRYGTNRALLTLPALQ